MPFLPGSQPPGARVVTVDGPEGRRGKPGTPGTPGDPALLFKGLPVGEALGVDADGNPVSLGPVGTGSATRAFAGPESEVGPKIAALPAGTEYSWTKTNGAGVLLDIVSGVA